MIWKRSKDIGKKFIRQRKAVRLEAFNRSLEFIYQDKIIRKCAYGPIEGLFYVLSRGSREVISRYNMRLPQPTEDGRYLMNDA